MKSIILYIWEGLWPIPPLNQIVTHLKEIKLLSQGRCTGTCSLPQLRWHKATPKAREQGKKKVLLFMWQVIVWVAAVDDFNNHNKDNHTPLKSYSLCLQQQHYLLSNFCSFCPPRNKIVNTVKLCQPTWILLPIPACVRLHIDLSTAQSLQQLEQLLEGVKLKAGQRKHSLWYPRYPICMAYKDTVLIVLMVFIRAKEKLVRPDWPNAPCRGRAPRDQSPSSIAASSPCTEERSW